VADEGFFSRWSRRKQATAQGVVLPEPPPQERTDAATAVPAQVAHTSEPAHAPVPVPESSRTQPEGATPAPSLDDVAALTPESDFAPFMTRQVSPEVKNAAMKKLFTDPHFNVMDRMDIYIDDYNTPDPLPASMLRQMASAQFLNLCNDTPEAADAARSADPVGTGDVAHGRTSEVVAQSQPETENSPSRAPQAQEPALDDPDLRLQPNPDPGPRRAEPGPV
jgi:hypothetical protein